MWIKKMRHRKLQSIMIFFMVAICTFLMAGSLTIMTSLQAPYDELIEETDPVDLRMFPNVNASVTGKDWEGTLSALDSVASVEKINAHVVAEQMEYKGKEIKAFVRLVEYSESDSQKFRILEGTTKQLKPDECIISSVLANEKNMKVGDTFSIKKNGKLFDYKIKAIFSDAFSLNSAFSLEIFLKTIPDDFGNQPYYSIRAKKGYDYRDIEREYEKKNGGIADANYVTPQESVTNASLTENILGAILLVLSVIVFVVVLFMIRYMVRNALLNDKKSVAVYKAMGYNNRQINQIYLRFYQSLAVAGGVVGILFAPLLSKGFLNAVFRNIGTEQQITGLWQGIACFCVINILYLITVYMELGKIKKMRPVEILIGTEDNLGVKKVKTPRKAKVNFSPLSMALSMMRRDKKNTVMIILTCFLSIYMVNVGLASFGNLDSMTEQNYYWLGFDKGDVTLTFQGDAESTDQLIDSLQEDQRVQTVVKRNLEDCMIGIKNGGTVGVLVYDSFADIKMPSVEGRLPENSDEIALGTRKLAGMHKSVGDYVDVVFAPDKTKKMLIVGSFQSWFNLGETGRMLGRSFEEQDVAINYTTASVALSKGADRAAFIKEMNKTYDGVAKFEKREDSFANVLKIIEDPQRDALGPFTILAVVVGALNLIYIIYLKNKNNQKTYSIYKSIGYPSSHLMMMNFWYVGVIAVVSMVVAVPVFIVAFPRVMVLAMSSFGFKNYPVFYNWNMMIWGNIGVLVLFMISTMLSSVQICRNHISDLVNE